MESGLPLQQAPAFFKLSAANGTNIPYKGFIVSRKIKSCYKSQPLSDGKQLDGKGRLSDRHIDQMQTYVAGRFVGFSSHSLKVLISETDLGQSMLACITCLYNSIESWDMAY